MKPTGKMPWDNLIDFEHYKTCGVTKRKICLVDEQPTGPGSNLEPQSAEVKED